MTFISCHIIDICAIYDIVRSTYTVAQSGGVHRIQDWSPYLSDTIHVIIKAISQFIQRDCDRYLLVPVVQCRDVFMDPKSGTSISCYIQEYSNEFHCDRFLRWTPWLPKHTEQVGGLSQDQSGLPALPLTCSKIFVFSNISKACVHKFLCHIYCS